MQEGDTILLSLFIHLTGTIRQDCFDWWFNPNEKYSRTVVQTRDVRIRIVWRT